MTLPTPDDDLLAALDQFTNTVYWLRSRTPITAAQALAEAINDAASDERRRDGRPPSRRRPPPGPSRRRGDRNCACRSARPMDCRPVCRAQRLESLPARSDTTRRKTLRPAVLEFLVPGSFGAMKRSPALAFGRVQSSPSRRSGAATHRMICTRRRLASSAPTGPSASRRPGGTVSTNERPNRRSVALRERGQRGECLRSRASSTGTVRPPWRPRPAHCGTVPAAAQRHSGRVAFTAQPKRRPG